MPFGLTSGPASFTRLMNLALSELTSTHCLAYLDDIIIWAPSLEEHLHRLRLLFDRIRTAALKLKPTQCRFLKKEVSFLGHVVSSEGIKTDPDKVETIRTWPIPVDIKELQSFIYRFNLEISTMQLNLSKWLKWSKQLNWFHWFGGQTSEQSCRIYRNSLKSFKL